MAIESSPAKTMDLAEEEEKQWGSDVSWTDSHISPLKIHLSDCQQPFTSSISQPFDLSVKSCLPDS